MAEETPKYAGPIGHRANGLSIQEIMLLTNGAVHLVYHDRKAKRTCAGALVENFDPMKEKIYTYGRTGKALRDAGTEGRLSGSIGLVGEAGEMTWFGQALAGKTVRTVEKWVRLLTFANAGVEPEELYERCLAFYSAPVNED